MQDYPLVSTIAVAFTAAWLLGILTQRLGLSPIVGYLVAGVLIGPHTPGFVGDPEIAHQLAEIGVILLMFGVGLHFHLRDLVAVRSVAIPGALVQSLVATALGFFVFRELGLSPLASAVIGMAMAVASTVVLMRVLMDNDCLNLPEGHVAVGWLLVEDVITVIVLVMIPVLGTTEQSHPQSIGQLAGPIAFALFKLVLLVAIVIVVGSRVIPWVLVQVARLRSRELFTLTVLVFSIAIAAGAQQFFGASMALGAFLAGMLVAQSPTSHQAAADALPLRDAFAVLFFVAVGMLFTPAFLFEQPLMILGAMAIIFIAKPLAALAIVALLGHSARIGLTVALGLAQIGEFSFILSDLARKYGLMPEEGHSVLVAAAIISITINPLLYRRLLSIENWMRRRPWLWRMLNGRAERRAQQSNVAAAEQLGEQLQTPQRLAVVVGFGPVGRFVHRLLREAGLATVVIDMNIDAVSELRSQEVPAIYGDASHSSILELAGMERASHLIIALPHTAPRNAVVTAARNLNPKASIFVRAHYLRERSDLEQAGATAAVFEEAEAAVALARLVLTGTGTHRDVVERKIRELRTRLIMENVTSARTRLVRTIMVPWIRVRRLATTDTRDDVLQQVSQHRYSRWPVTEPGTGKVVGYLLAKDLLAQGSANGDWKSLVRPLRAVRPEDDVESTLAKLQSESATVAIVDDAGSPVGLITLENILEQVVGLIEDEYPREAQMTLAEAVTAGGVLLNLAATTANEAIEELAAAIPADRLPPCGSVAELAIEREQEVSTDLGVGVAVPHARCPDLKGALVVFGRSVEGVQFSSSSPEPVRLIFLLVTPLDEPDLQLALLARLARVAGDAALRERLCQATTEADVIDAVAEAQEAPGAARSE